MRNWFLSYNSQDIALMQGLEAALKRKDPEAGIFFAPTSLKAGAFWLPELAKRIGEATAFVLLIGEKGLGPWQAIEYCEALDRRVKDDFPVILLLLDGQPAPGLPFLRQLHWVITADPSSEKTVAQVLEAAAGGGASPDQPWRHAAPYRGLAAMTESDTDYFFGRSRQTIAVINALAETPDKLPVLLGNSGVGKSSLAQAGVLAAFVRQAWPETVGSAPAWPQAFDDSRQWCVLKLNPGTDPLKALVEPFLQTWQHDPTDSAWEDRRAGWIARLLDGKATLPGLLDATERRYRELGQSKPPAFLLYVDQGEELYVRSAERQRRRFSEILAHGLEDPRLRALMSLRTDFFHKLQEDETLYAVHRQINIPPLREAELREVVSRPAGLLSARFETEGLAAYIAGRAAEESTKAAGALPLLSYLLDDMWTKMVDRGDGVLRLPAQTFELGGVLVDRANAFLARHPKSEDPLRRIFTLKLATVREDGEPTRRRALQAEFSEEEWQLVSELADHPNRLLVTATPEVGETYAEVAHEAIFRRWDKLRNWIAAEREFLAWKTGLEAARRAWQATPGGAERDALLMGSALANARSWYAKRAEDLPGVDREFIDRSLDRDRRARRQMRRVQVLMYVLLVGIITVLVGWINQSYVMAQVNWLVTGRPYMLAQVRPHVLTAEAERALEPQASFRECAKDCPEMIVLPAGEFTMGSPATEPGRADEDEGPQHKVTIDRPFAVSKFTVTFTEWDACVAVGGCPQVSDSGYGRGSKPVINVTWDEAKQYAAWFAMMTGRPYRLLTEPEWEYAARAGTTTAYPWGDEIGRGNANCNACGSMWDGRETSPVGSFKPNAFGLYDMHGNVWQWVEDCYHGDYNGAPTYGFSWTGGDCSRRVFRGGSWFSLPAYLRSANRGWNATGYRVNLLGFRVARTLAAGEIP